MIGSHGLAMGWLSLGKTEVSLQSPVDFPYHSIDCGIAISGWWHWVYPDSWDDFSGRLRWSAPGQISLFSSKFWPSLWCLTFDTDRRVVVSFIWMKSSVWAKRVPCVQSTLPRFTWLSKTSTKTRHDVSIIPFFWMYWHLEPPQI